MYPDIFQGLLEGQGTKVAIFEKVLSVIQMDVIVYMAVGDDDEDPPEYDEDEEELNTEALYYFKCSVISKNL